MQAAEKGSFPTLLKKLQDTKSYYLVSGFKGAGLWPFDQSAVNIKKCITKVELQDSGVTPENGPDTPCEILRQAIVNVIATQPSAETQIAVANAKKQCKCVQAKEVEVLTTPAVQERLREEAEARSAKRKSALKKKPKKSLHFDGRDNNSDESEIRR